MSAREFRIFGVPGAGKTTHLSTIAIPDACEEFGAENVMVTSFTRTGAKEIATKKSRLTGQTISIPSENVGTLHSICYHALQAPRILETDRKLIQQWNEKYPDLAISGKSVRSADGFDDVAVDDDIGGAGDKWLSALNIKRNRMLLDKLTWHTDLKRFEKNWTAFKEETVTVDFTDLIEICLRDRPYAPNMPSVLFVDEAQDCSKLQIVLARSWAQNMEKLVMVGDDDQSIFGFAGASADAFLTPELPPDQVTLLEQTYRCPELVFLRAGSVIERVSKRQKKQLRPRLDPDGKVVEGLVREHGSSYRTPDQVLCEAADMARSGRTVMILATCSYMLEPAKKYLMQHGVPFENFYRRTRKDWNPLYVPEKKQNGRETSHTVEFLNDFLSMGEDEGFWNVPQFVNWCQHLKVGEAGLKRKVGKQGIEALKLAIQQNEPGLETCRNVISMLLEPPAVERALERDVGWFCDSIKSDKGNSSIMDYALKVVHTHGRDALTDRPRLLIGTVHSVKGGQADSVVLFPDVSWQADAEMQLGQDGCDRAYRVMYVGMTRAYEELILCAPSVKYSKQAPRMFVPL